MRQAFPLHSFASFLHSQMQNQSQHQAVKNIYTMLSEMATGNLSFRLQLYGEDHELDEIANLLNTTAQKIQVVLKQFENTEQQTPNTTIDTYRFQNIHRYILDNLLEPHS